MVPALAQRFFAGASWRRRLDWLSVLISQLAGNTPSCTSSCTPSCLFRAWVFTARGSGATTRPPPAAFECLFFVTRGSYAPSARRLTERQKNKAQARVAYADNSKIFYSFLHRAAQHAVQQRKIKYRMSQLCAIFTKLVVKVYLLFTLLTVFYCVFRFIHLCTIRY